MTISHILFVFRALGTKSPPSCFKLLKGLVQGRTDLDSRREGSLKPVFLSWLCSSVVNHSSAMHETLKFDCQHQKANILAGQTDMLQAKVIYIH